MIVLTVSYETEEYDELLAAVQKANKLRRNILFSLTERVGRTDPLSFYYRGQAQFSGARFFWQNETGNQIIAGLGQAVKIDADKEGSRVKNVRNRWREILDTAVLSGVSGGEGTGPLLLGGFSFDPKTKPSGLWHRFGAGLFYIPALSLTDFHGQTYLTINLACSAGDDPEKLMDRLQEMKKNIPGKLGTIPISRERLIEKKEKEPDEWKRTVQRAVYRMTASDLDKIVLARALELVFDDPINSESVMGRLREQQKGNFIFSLESSGDCFLGATPERLVRKRGNELFSTCLAGSIIRGKDEASDKLLGDELLKDPKNRLEHQYVVSAIKEALERLCKSLSVPDEPIVMKNKHIQHLYTPVQGTCDPDVSVFDVIDRLHPTPALGGVPTDKAVIWIRENEKLERGLYASPIGWADAFGNGEFAVGIRSALIHGKKATLFAGCGVLQDSIPEKEYEETAVKFRPMLSAFGVKL
ncbi:isochorismate synthase [Sporolactobacillus putidus]|uniref:Isochorismate synthase MenF n=1 Tax=Sporolactobacillus putidus TaxID=492735 RepID=A0A917S0B6_9BACL|nr:isochorismate synthase [Sporolactobacillus putidus]GGL48586.1 isochorismate synthase MenF [Sporolactobacillus putidus]